MDELFAELFHALPVGLLTLTYFPSDDPRKGVLLAANAAASRNLGVDLAPYVGVVTPADPEESDFDRGEADALQQMSFDVATSERGRRMEAFEVAHGPARGFYEASLFPWGNDGSHPCSGESTPRSRPAGPWTGPCRPSNRRTPSSTASPPRWPMTSKSANRDQRQCRASEDDGDALPADAVEPVDRVMELSRLSADMIDGLLRYARRPTAAFDSTADLGEVAEWVISVLQDDIASVEAAVDIGPLPIVVGHPAAIRQVLFNLVSNSLRYRHPDRMPLVTIGSVAGDERLVVEVVDNGLGIDERDRERIFEWGYRGSATSATAGTGLGLAACRAALANTGAEIALGPAPAGGGTAMVLRFTSPT